MNMDELRTTVVRFLTEYGFQIIGALIILVAGALIARWLARTADQWFVKKQVEPPIRMLSVRVIRLTVFLLAAVLAMEKCGVPIAPMVAGIGVAGVGIGLATQHVLSNLVAGLTIIFTKPFRVGEYIDVIGVEGQVVSIELFSTSLLHPDRSRIVIPNRKLVGEVLHNYGAIRQLDVTVGVAYNTNIHDALWTLQDLLSRSGKVLKQPEPLVGITSLGDSSVVISVKPWVSVENFNAAIRELNQTILEQFRARNIDIPFPQREVRLVNPPGVSAAGARHGRP